MRCLVKGCQVQRGGERPELLLRHIYGSLRESNFGNPVSEIYIYLCIYINRGVGMSQMAVVS